MADSLQSTDRTDGCGRLFICETTSPDGFWRIEVFGPNEYSNGPVGYAKPNDSDCGWGGQFSLGPKPATVEQISFRWDLPNGAWGGYVDGECWAVCITRPALRVPRKRRIHSRGEPHDHPYTDDEIRFLCAKRRGQKKGTKGFIIEE